ncbi:MAG: Mur ligase family protein [Clostridia bacterium]|nr:Mur ligase family protein [Clostridia bacterium]
MKKLLAVWMTKFLIFFGKLAGKKGSSTPGEFALKIYPNILKDLSKQVRKDIIAVCGTNGKTTTNNILNSIIKSSGNKTVCNNVGANMLPGVVTAFISSCSLLGRLDADYACIEIDEISAAKVFEHFKPSYIVFTNFFRDQLDRYGEIDIILGFLKNAVNMCDDTKLIINGDDPLVSAFAIKSGKTFYSFGVGQDVGIALKETKEGRFCLLCGEELKYKYYHYSQLGDYECTKCGFKRPDINFEAKNVNLDNGIVFDVNGKHFDVKYRGFYNIYNILAAYSTAKTAGISTDKIDKVLNEYKPQIGRMQEFNIKGKQVIFNLSKNPAGFNQAISTVICDKRKKSIVTVINDRGQDGKDISWIWDVDFERFSDANIKELYASGIRHNDVSVRFKYAGFDNFCDVGDVKEAIIKGVEDESDVLYVLVNYTALFSTETILKGMEDK